MYVCILISNKKENDMAQLSTNFESWDFGGYKTWAIEATDGGGKTLYSGFSRRDCVDFWNDHNLSDADFRIVGMI